MAEFPHIFAVPDPLVTLSTYSEASVGGTNLTSSNSASGSAWPTANLAIFVPFRLTRPIVFTTLFTLNGTPSGNIDVGVYSSDGTKIVSSGSTAMSGSSVIQSFTVSSTELSPGLFYFAAAMNNTTGGLSSNFINTVGTQNMLGLAQAATSFPLPATVTFASAANKYVPMMGLTTRSFV